MDVTLMKLEELKEEIKKPKHFHLVFHANVEGMRLYLERKVDAVSEQDAVMQVKHRLESSNEKYVDLTDLNWLVHRIREIGPSKSSQRAERLNNKKRLDAISSK